MNDQTFLHREVSKWRGIAGALAEELNEAETRLQQLRNALTLLVDMVATDRPKLDLSCFRALLAEE